VKALTITEPTRRDRLGARAASAIGGRRRALLGATGFAGAYMALSYVLLQPVLSTFVIADDFEGPFAVTRKAGPGLGGAISLGWHLSWLSGDRTRILGTLSGEIFNWAWLWICSTFGVAIETYYAVAKLLVLIACAVAVAGFWWIAARNYFRPVRFRTALVLTSVALFGSLQLHGLWSNDPVQSYPLAGYGSTAIGFLVLVAAIWAAERWSPRRLALATVAGLVAVSWYEMNLGAVLGGGIILLFAAWRHRSDRRLAASHLAGAAVFTLIPIVWIVATRYTSVSDTYSGRALQSNGAVHAFLISFIGSLPGAAWKLEWETLGARPPLTVLAIASATVVMLAVAAWLYRDTIRAPAESRALAGERSLGRAAIAAVACYALFAIGLESATERINSGSLRIGDVYTFYAVGSAAVALAVAVGVWVLAERSGRRWRWIQIPLVAGFGAFLALQGSFNAKLRDVTNADMVQNHRFDQAFAGGVPEATRCGALVYWASYPWPDYYRDDVVVGSDRDYRTYYQQPLCGNWVDPTDGFSEPWGAAGSPQWWMTGGGGVIEIGRTGCVRGCSGTLNFTAAGFALPHQVTLTLEGSVVARLSVPTRPTEFQIPLRLSGRFTQIGVSASGHGVTPASVTGSPDTRTLFVVIGAPRFIVAGTAR
jgi:hypothetical protein